MNSEREIVSLLFESKMIEETKFVYNGNEYEHYFGNYRCNGKPITREEYHKARKELLAKEDKPGSFDYLINMPSKIAAQKIEDFNNFIDKLHYDKEYDLKKETRDHIKRYNKDDIKGRVSQIIKDTGMSVEDAKKVNRLISEYTSTMTVKIKDSDRKLIDEFIDKSPVYSKMPIYRGLGFSSKKEGDLDKYNIFKNLEIGSVNTFKDYTSFSSNQDVALEFANSNGEYQVLMVNTKNLSGVSIDHLSSIDYPEDELLYKADTQIVIKNKRIKGNTVYLHVEEVSLNEEDINDPEELPIEGSMCLNKEVK